MATFTKQIDSDIRDVGYTNTSPSLSSALNLGNPGAATRSIALRFIGVTINNAATINSAKITFVASSTKTPSVTLKIEGVAEDNTAEFVISPENTARTRTKTTANKAWSGSIAETNGSNLDTVDITNIVQEIVNRAGWVNGNAMGFWISDNGSAGGNTLDVEEFSTSSSVAAILTIDYVSATTTTSTSTSSSTTTTSTSITTTSTSSTSTSTSTTTLPPEIYGIKILKNKVSETSLSPRNFFMNSAYKLLKNYKRGSFSAVYVKGSGLTIKINYPELNFRPFVLIWMQRMGHDGVLDTDYHLLEWAYWGASKIGYQRYSVYNDHTQIDYEDNLVDDLNLGSFTIKGYYMIFDQEVGQ